MDSVLRVPTVCRQRIDDVCLINHFSKTPIPIITLIAGYLDQPSFFEFVRLSWCHFLFSILCNSADVTRSFIIPQPTDWPFHNILSWLNNWTSQLCITGSHFNIYIYDQVILITQLKLWKR